MACFGLGTLPAMLATSLGAARVQAFLGRRGLTLILGGLLISAGLWSLYLTVAHGSHLSAPAPGPGSEAVPAPHHHGH